MDGGGLRSVKCVFEKGGSGMVRAITLVSVFVAALPLAAQDLIELKEVRNPPDPVPLLRLLANPEKYDGKYIQLIGYLHLQFEGNGLWLHKEDYDHGIYGNSIWVDVTPKMEKALKEINDKYVIMHGVFDAKWHGHAGLFEGALTKINRCEVWSDPKNPWRNTLRDKRDGKTQK